MMKEKTTATIALGRGERMPRENSNPGRNRNNKSYQPGRSSQRRHTSQLKVGDQVFFHFALKDKGSLECRGFVLRQPGPKTEGEIYKVIVAAVTASSLGPTKLTPQCIIGNKVVRKIDQLSTQAPAWWSGEWITLRPQCIQEAINRARNIKR
jgi:hypothetical protein